MKFGNMPEFGLERDLNIKELPMLDFKPLSMMDLRSSPGDILDRVSRSGEAFIIEKNGEQKACLVPISVFFPDIKKDRLFEELEELHKKGRDPKLQISESRDVEMSFLEDISSKKVTIKIVLPHGYPNAAPKIYADPISDDAPHRWQDGSLCILGAMANWNPGKHNIAFVLDLSRKWMDHYYKWKSTGKWPSGMDPVDE